MNQAPRKAFTLVEVIVAMGAFVIAFLAGFAAIAMLMQQMQIGYRTTVAASAATLVLSEFTDYSNPFLDPLQDKPGLRFYGGPVDIGTIEADVESGAAKAFIFKDGKVSDIDLSAYNRNLVVVYDKNKPYATLWSAPIYVGGKLIKGRFEEGRNMFRLGETKYARCDFLGKYDIP